MKMDEGVLRRAREAYRRLDVQVREHLPDWDSRGDEDPARVLIEAFAAEIARLEGSVDEIPTRLVGQILSELGASAQTPVAARTAVGLTAKLSLDRAVRVPAETRIAARRRDDGEKRGIFSTVRDAWIGPQKLERAVACDRDRTVDLPLS
ncbi:MAG: type VI secretion system baseplate subunit TssF, partial [Planctomycetota bacterium]